MDRLQYQYKRYDDAEEQYAAVLEINDHNPIVHYHLAFLQRDSFDNQEQAKKYFDKVR